MFCIKCGQTLSEGTRFCPKCGANTQAPVSTGGVQHNGQLPVQQPVYSQPAQAPYAQNIPVQENKADGLVIASFILSGIGIIGRLWSQFSGGLPYVMQNILWILLYGGILLAVVSLYKQRNKLAFIAGIVPCSFAVLMQFYWLLMRVL